MKYWTSRLGVAIVYATTDHINKTVPNESFDVLLRAEVDIDSDLPELTKEIIENKLTPEINLIIYTKRKSNDFKTRKSAITEMFTPELSCYKNS